MKSTRHTCVSASRGTATPSACAAAKGKRGRAEAAAMVSVDQRQGTKNQTGIKNRRACVKRATKRTSGRGQRGRCGRGAKGAGGEGLTGADALKVQKSLQNNALAVSRGGVGQRLKRRHELQQRSAKIAKSVRVRHHFIRNQEKHREQQVSFINQQPSKTRHNQTIGAPSADHKRCSRQSRSSSGSSSCSAIRRRSRQRSRS